MADWSLSAHVAVFAAATLVILAAGTRLAGVADRLADATGWGEALIGAVLLGASTSLPGLVTTVTAASEGHPQLAAANALGGILAQTAFLGVADVAWRQANLEHAAASPANLVQGTLLILMLAVPLAAAAAPEWTIAGIHPASVALFLLWAFGLRLIRGVQEEAAWFPLRTRETKLDEPAEPPGRERALRLGASFALLGLVTAAAGWALARSGLGIIERTELSETLVGSLFTAVASSLPELVTSVAAVRRGALTLAVGGILGGNCFDVLFLGAADVAWREGSVLHALGAGEVFVAAATIVLTALLLLGLLRREKHGVANIGFESLLVLVGYAGSVLVLALAFR